MALTFNHGVTQTLQDFTPPIDAKRFVKPDGTLCAAGERAAGVSINSVTTDSKSLGVVCTGIAIITAGASVSKNQETESDADGKAIPLNTGKANGIIWDDGSAGDDVRILIR